MVHTSELTSTRGTRCCQDDVLRRITYAVYIEALRRGGGDLSDQRNEPTVDQLIARGCARLLAGSNWVLFDEAGPAFREALRREPESATERFQDR
jgi:hypothetical protein